ncbi:PAS domain-containing sensor histidine kinase [Clostridium swellfunianum]|uniref:sensor histidine kinase n=1 Tax=Clostridium swellfunianum TaxID=1367462 RepID=UPI00202DB784|nr:PAS domain-containing sensor histidine kinase [Clostridium swellfunianum]MCM0649640.1 PAS domain-containing sensor histidine kinase [Clostridium swellfunianum]
MGSDKSPYLLVRDGLVIKISQQFIDLTGFSFDELLNQNIDSIFKILRIGPDVNTNDIDENIDYFLFTKLLEVRRVNIKLVEEAQIKCFVFEEKPNFNLDAKFPLMSKLCLDNYYGIAVFSLPDMILLKANETFASFFDKPFNKKENCIGRRVSDFVTGFKGSTSEKIWQTIVETGKTHKIDEYVYDRFERGITYWKTTLTPICENGKLKYCIEMTEDITEQVLYRKTVEEQARVIKEQNERLKLQAEEIKQQKEELLSAEYEKNIALEKALEMKDEFLSLITHEFRTPLNVINTAIQAINYFCINELSERTKKYVDMIRLNTFRQLRLVNNLLDITRANAGRIKINKKNLDIVFISKAITESVQAYASQKGVEVTFISKIHRKVIGIDDEKYERILLNLLSNAIKFTPKGKSITVSLASKKKSICIEVKDEGIGIPKDKMKVIFERFGQVDSSLSRQAEGTGIGLSLVKRFIEALDGSISVKSTVNKGSTFSILLPDEIIDEKENEMESADLMDNRLVQVTNVEFSDIYL